MLKSEIFFTSDLHIAHRRVLEYCPNRKFSTVTEMENRIINNWNSIVKPDDYVVVVGDMFLGGSKQWKIDFMSSLNGHKILVSGNHDESDTKMMKLGFDWVCKQMKMNINGNRVLINHFPYKPSLFKACILWFKGINLKHLKNMPKNTGEILLHGHTHSTKKVFRNMINVGVDAWGMKPVSSSQIASLISKMEKK